MNEYEIVYTYLNGCAGAAHPITQVLEAQAPSPEAYLREKHGRDWEKFTREDLPAGQSRYSFQGEAVTYIYEFTRL